VSYASSHERRSAARVQQFGQFLSNVSWSVGSVTFACSMKESGGL